MSKFSENIYVNPFDNSPRREVRWKEKTIDGAIYNGRRRCPSEDAAVRFAMEIEQRINKQEKRNNQLEHGIKKRLLVVDALIVYRRWLIECDRTPLHIRGAINLISKQTQLAGIRYCDEITYKSMHKMVQNVKRYADHGRKLCTYTKTFLGRMDRIENVLIDESAFRYGKDGEIPSPDDPKSPGTFEEIDYTNMLAEILKPNPALLMPSGTGRGRTSTQSRNKTDATLYYNRRMALLPIFLYLRRYGNRFALARNLRVSFWNPETRTLTIPPPKNKKENPRVIYIDEFIASIINHCCQGKSGDEYIFSPAYTRGNNLINPKWSHENLSHTFKQVCRACNIKGTPNWMRHTAITDICDKLGGELKLVAEVTGHRQISTLQKYIKTRKSHMTILADNFNRSDADSFQVGQVTALMEGLTAKKVHTSSAKKVEPDSENAIGENQSEV